MRADEAVNVSKRVNAGGALTFEKIATRTRVELSQGNVREMIKVENLTKRYAGQTAIRI